MYESSTIHEKTPRSNLESCTSFQATTPQERSSEVDLLDRFANPVFDRLSPREACRQIIDLRCGRPITSEAQRVRLANAEPRAQRLESAMKRIGTSADKSRDNKKAAGTEVRAAPRLLPVIKNVAETWSIGRADPGPPSRELTRVRKRIEADYRKMPKPRS